MLEQYILPNIPYICFPLLCFLVSFGYFLRNLRAGNADAICWFCHHRELVPLTNKNSFVCAQCNQYNGFNSDGSYNQLIPEQYCSDPLSVRQFAHPSPFKTQSDVLCSTCKLHQETLILKLAQFEPTREDRWNVELDAFRTKMEQLYPLCAQCFVNSKTRVNQVDAELLPSFLDWWNSKRREHWKRQSSSSGPRLSRIHCPSSFLPPCLYRLTRYVTISGLVTFVGGPIIFLFVDRYCSVRTDLTYLPILKLIARHSSFLSAYREPLCTHLLDNRNTLDFSPLVRLWLILLLLVLQFVLVCIRIFQSNSSETHKRSTILFLLVDVILFLLVCHVLLDSLHSVFNSDTAQSNLLRFYGLFVLAAVLLPVLISVSFSLFKWFSFCSHDLNTQVDVLKQTWPSKNGSINLTFPVWDQRTKLSGIRHTEDCMIPEFQSNCNVSGNGSIFRPSVLGSIRGSTLTPSSVFNLTGRSSTGLRTNVDLESLDGSADSWVTSVSRSNPRNQMTHGRKLRLSKRQKRSGLIRFCLFLLFGRVETWNDVVAELICLFNALLVGVVIFGIAQFFSRLVRLF